MSTTSTAARFAWIHSNAYDTLAILEGDTVVSQWTVTSAVAQEYIDSPDAADWDRNFPDCTAISDYGTEVTGDELHARIEFFLK